MRTFDAVGKTPVLLSMLILVLGEQGRGTLALPRSPPAPASTTKAKSQCQLP